LSLIDKDKCPPVASTTAVVDGNFTRFIHLVGIVQQLFLWLKLRLW